ncbi:hypothetical protein EXN66_Car001596 [Channa argus]|uniref:Uncharacterized protein n=1 Tax=Channa argus TaxID=215402 RepID=A0A6G1R0J5_CHAAH|nr:hypothetical protein EXN66_Car001596 [Channa argus]
MARTHISRCLFILVLLGFIGLLPQSLQVEKEKHNKPNRHRKPGRLLPILKIYMPLEPVLDQ